MNISIIIKKDDNSSKYIVIIRKFTGKSIAEIKSAIENEKPVFTCELFKNNDCRELVKTVVKELINQGAKLAIIKKENDKTEEVTVNYLLSRINRFREISQQNQELDDLMYGDE